jgi:hypothetical protein
MSSEAEAIALRMLLQEMLVHEGFEATAADDKDRIGPGSLMAVVRKHVHRISTFQSPLRSNLIKIPMFLVLN